MQILEGRAIRCSCSMPQKTAKDGSQDGFYPSAQHHRACNINLLRRTPPVCGRIAYSVLEGADLSRLLLGSRLECASEKEAVWP